MALVPGDIGEDEEQAYSWSKFYKTFFLCFCGEISLSVCRWRGTTTFSIATLRIKEYELWLWNSGRCILLSVITLHDVLPFSTKSNICE